MAGRDFEEVQAAFDLCRQGVFDDFVPHWVSGQDSLRLRTSVWNAARDVRAASGPSAKELVTHAEQVVAINQAGAGVTACWCLRCGIPATPPGVRQA